MDGGIEVIPMLFFVTEHLQIRISGLEKVYRIHDGLNQCFKMIHGGKILKVNDYQ